MRARSCNEKESNALSADGGAPAGMKKAFEDGEGVRCAC